MGFRIEKRLREFRVIGEEQQAFARLVESAHGGEVGVVEMFQAVIDGGPALRVVARRHQPARLVQHVVDEGFRCDRLAIHRDPRRCQVHPGFQLGCLTTIDRHPPGQNQRFCLGARAEAELGKRAPDGNTLAAITGRGRTARGRWLSVVGPSHYILHKVMPRLTRFQRSHKA